MQSHTFLVSGDGPYISSVLDFFKGRKDGEYDWTFILGLIPLDQILPGKINIGSQEYHAEYSQHTEWWVMRENSKIWKDQIEHHGSALEPAIEWINKYFKIL